MPIVITETIIKKTEIQTKDIYRVLKGRHPSTAKQSYEAYEKLFKKACELIKEHRYEIFGTFQGYKIVTNGYKGLKRIEFDDKNLVSGKVVINKLFKILEGGEDNASNSKSYWTQR